jgi:pectinesterase
MIDRPPYRVVYPISGEPTTQGHVDRNKELDKTNRWGKRAYFYNCHHDGSGDYAWHADNLLAAAGSPKPAEITAKWTFGGTWDPESSAAPAVIRRETTNDGRTRITFAEPVTLRGDRAGYISGSGSDTLAFSMPPDDGAIIVASQASVALRTARLAKGE